ncbi:MAG: CocE/NonD family hydrolase [Pseudomonadota bacterium]
MRLLSVFVLCGVLAACGGGSESASGSSGGSLFARSVEGSSGNTVSGSANVNPGASGSVNVTPPPLPAPGQARAGKSYSVFLKVPATGDTVAFTVFEPATLTGGQTYPLILHSHGFQGARYKSKPIPLQAINVDLANPLGSDFTDIGVFIDQGYGVISIDERAHGDSNGSDRVMDPDFEGKDLLAVIDWAEANLPWLKYGMSADGTDPRNLVLGSIGTSYGGMFQYLIHNIDPKKRLDAMVPMWAPYDLTYSLAPGNTPKTLWNFALFGIGNLTGLKTLTGFDPFIFNGFIQGFAQNELSPELKDLLVYHSNRYFCEGKPVATNGGPGTRPERPPVPGGKVNALIVQGIRDTLFNLNEGYQNYQCLKAQGGDVRLLTTQVGHNTLQTVPDFDQALFHPSDVLNTQCGTIDPAAGALAFFNQHLKGMAGAADGIPKKLCLSISGKDAALVDDLTVGRAGTQVRVPPSSVLAGLPELANAVPLGITAGAGGEVVAGIPRLEVTVAATSPLARGEPIIFAGLGIELAAGAPVYELLNNQVTPLKGLGRHDIDLSGVAARLKPGQKLVLLLYGGKDQYLASGSVSLNVAKATIMPVTVSGNLWVPRIGLPASTAP